MQFHQPPHLPHTHHNQLCLNPIYECQSGKVVPTYIQHSLTSFLFSPNLENLSDPVRPEAISLSLTFQPSLITGSAKCCRTYFDGFFCTRTFYAASCTLGSLVWSSFPEKVCGRISGFASWLGHDSEGLGFKYTCSNNKHPTVFKYPASQQHYRLLYIAETTNVSSLPRFHCIHGSWPSGVGMKRTETATRSLRAKYCQEYPGDNPMAAMATANPHWLV